MMVRCLLLRLCLRRCLWLVVGELLPLLVSCLRLRDRVTGPESGSRASWQGNCNSMGLNCSSSRVGLRDSSDKLERYSCTRASPKLKMLSEAPADFPGDVEGPNDVEEAADWSTLLGVWIIDDVPETHVKLRLVSVKKCQ